MKDRDPGVRGEKCPTCRRKFLAGQPIIHQAVPVRGLDLHITYHAACMGEIVAAAPAGRNERDHKEAFEALRTRIVTTGDLFPDDH